MIQVKIDESAQKITIRHGRGKVQRLAEVAKLPRERQDGLSNSKTIIEAHGGQIWAEPTLGGGATFRFTLRGLTAEETGDAG